MLQKKTSTAPNRYPGIFRTVQSHIRETHGPDLLGRHLKVLSFGCSMGMEVFSVRAYFPDSQIFACDRDPAALKIASKSLKNDPCHLFLSTPESISENGPYDLIFAMSVFCQYPDSKKTDQLTSIYPFSLFEKLAGNLDENLKPGGMFCLINSNYLFRDLGCSDNYSPMRSPLIAGNGFIDKFAKNGDRLTESLGNRRKYSHRKMSEGIVDDDLRDCVYIKSGDGVVEEDRFLRREAPEGAVEVDSFPVAGESLETAVAEKRVALELRGRLCKAGDGQFWLCQEWFKSRLDGEIERFGEWWTPCPESYSPKPTDSQLSQTKELKKYIKKYHSPYHQLKSVFKR